MRKRVLLNASPVYVEYDVDRSGNRVIQRVLLPGDLLEVTERLTDVERAKLQRAIDRPIRRVV
jgi:hypothetical protein